MLDRISVLIACRRRQLSGSLRGIRRLKDLRTRDGPRLGDLRLRRMVTRWRRVEEGPNAARELDLHPGTNVGASQGGGTPLGAALRVGAHDDARVNAQLVEHEGHEGRVLLVVTDQVLIPGEHALESVGAHARTRVLGVLVEVEAVG